jgi:hypothetical protein
MGDVLERLEEESSMTLHAHQEELERLFSKNQLIPRIRAEIEGSGIDFKAYMEEQGIPYEFGISLLIQMALHKRANLPTLVGLLYHHLNDAQATADMLKRCAEADLVDWSPDLRIFVVKITISEDVQAELDCFQFPLPMVVRPNRIQNNRMSGYLLNQKSVILRNNHHDDDVCLDHLNRMNRIPLTINMDVVKKVKNTWKNLDKPKEGETLDEFKSRQRQFDKYDRTAKDVIDVLVGTMSIMVAIHGTKPASNFMPESLFLIDDWCLGRVPNTLSRRSS